MGACCSPRICFRCFNPYESRLPGRRVVSRETLHLIKLLREEGYSVAVEPDDGRPLEYLAEKGLREFLSDPVYAELFRIPLTVVLGIVSAWLYERRKRKPADDEVNVVLEADESGKKVRYNHRGKPISDKRLQAILDLMNKRGRTFAESLAQPPPDSVRPVPIYLEHTGQIVGWGKLCVDEKGLRVETAKITDDRTWERIQCDDLRGFSIGALVYSSECSICKEQYVVCNHISGREYEGMKCVVKITGFDLAEVSVVCEPVHPLAKIERQQS